MSSMPAPLATPRAASTREAKPSPARGGRLNPPMADWTGRRVWIVGASTGIGRALAHALYAQGADVCVSARNAQALQSFIDDHPRARALPLDATDVTATRAAAQQLGELGALDLVVYCAGHYRELRATAYNLDEMLRHQQVNYIGALYMLDAVLPSLLAAGQGHISLVGSVAGFRGLPKSLAYGPTKAALINLAQTLYMDLRDRGIGVSLVNPGFVQTRLTAANDFEMPALISPERAAQDILAGWARGRFEIHFPRRFTWSMKLLGLLPFGLYQALVRRITGL
jgi:NAD(P)-dependent dehydrogenase (short-subunit alcohol dehydrogenase family)